MIPITAVDVSDAEPLVTEVVRSGALVQGPMVRRLEQGFAEIAGTRHAIAVNSGTTALAASLQALGLRPGDEVVTSPFTFVATLNAAIQAGATVRFADVDAEDLTLSPERVAAAVTGRTRALLPVHLYGQMARMDELAAIAEEHGLHIVEDAAQAVGAAFAGRPAGSYGLGCFSLYATKNLTTAEGGMITTDGDALADRLRMLRNHGMRARYTYEIPGHNYRMTDLHAALGIPQLARLPETTEARRRNAARLSEGLAGIPGVSLPEELPGRRHVWHQYTVRVGPGAALSRDELATALAERGIATGVYYPRVVFDYACYTEHPLVVPTTPEDVPVAASAAREVLSLPVHSALTDEQLDTIVAVAREALHA